MSKKKEVAAEVTAKMLGWPDWPNCKGLRYLMFMAMDKHGHWYGFIHEPIMTTTGWNAVDRHRIILESADVPDSEMSIKLWRKSLRVRPKEIKPHSVLSDLLVWPNDESFEFMACDRDNRWWAFVEPPELTERGWAVVLGHPAAILVSDHPPLNVEWQSTLVARR